MNLTPKNWESFQHYKNRKPPWIKLHRGLLDDYAFSQLPVASRALAPFLWLLASEYEGGKITAGKAEIAFRLHLSEKELETALSPLISGGFFVASEMLAGCKQGAMLEREREEEEETETETEGESARRGRVRSSKSLLSDDWRPSEGPLTSHGEAELLKMRDWARSNAIRKADWDATWRNWMRRAGGKCLADPTDTAPIGIHVKADTPQWRAWVEYQGRSPPIDRNFGWRFPTEWPPGHEERAA